MNTLYLIGVESNRRVRLFLEETKRAGLRTRVIDWHTVLRGEVDWPDKPHIRIESFGEDSALESRLIRRGRIAMGFDPDAWDCAHDHGRIRQLEALYRGFAAVLAELPLDARFMCAPADILAMFDKRETRRRLDSHKIPGPEFLGEARSWSEVRDTCGSNNRIFLKPRHSSSASGILAIRWAHDRIAATTSIEHVDGRLYNTLKVRRLHRDDEIARIVDLLGREDSMIIERWIPKDTAQRGTYDLRFVVIDGRADHAVMRVSGSPMTNLHLGNRRGDLEALRNEIGQAWSMLRDTAVEAARAFENSLHAGVDIGLVAGRRAATVFEVNAFGDLLPEIVDARGRSTYRAEIDAWLARTGD